jgi:large subunit ribosomal protein L33
VTGEFCSPADLFDFFDLNGNFFLDIGDGNVAYENIMAREHIILECTEARGEGKPVSRYMSTRNKKSQTERVEKMKYNKFLRRHTLHREIKK